MALVGGGRALLVANPGSRRATARLPAAQRAFAAAGIACDALLTEHPGHAASLVGERATGYDAVFTLGGDGTAMEVIGSLVGSGIPVGVLPGGTGNLIARALGTPLQVPRAVAALVRGTARDFDLGRFGDGRHFAFAAGIGIDATMVADTTADAKRRFGIAAYVATAVPASLALDAFTLRATVDGVPHTFRATAALLANFGTVFNGVITLGPEIRPNDGMLDLCVFTPADVRDAVRIGWRVMRKDFAPDPAMHFLKGTHFLLETDPPRPIQADGELLGQTPVEVTVVVRGARLIVPTVGRGAWS